MDKNKLWLPIPNFFVKCLCSFIHSSVAHFQELRQAFSLFDKNNDGYIDAKELVHCTTTLGQTLSPEEVKAFLEEADLNGDGKLDYVEFAKMMTSFDA